MMANWNDPGWEGFAWQTLWRLDPTKRRTYGRGILVKGGQVNRQTPPQMWNFPRVDFKSIEDGSSNTILVVEKGAPRRLFVTTSAISILGDLWLLSGADWPSHALVRRPEAWAGPTRSPEVRMLGDSDGGLSLKPDDSRLRLGPSRPSSARCGATARRGPHFDVGRPEPCSTSSGSAPMGRATPSTNSRTPRVTQIIRTIGWMRAPRSAPCWLRSPGCGGGSDGNAKLAEFNSNSMQRLANLYFTFQLENDLRGPKDEAELRKFIAGIPAGELVRRRRPQMPRRLVRQPAWTSSRTRSATA